MTTGVTTRESVTTEDIEDYQLFSFLFVCLCEIFSRKTNCNVHKKSSDCSVYDLDCAAVLSRHKFKVSLIKMGTILKFV